MQVKFGEFKAMETNKRQSKGKPSRDRREARENKRYGG